MNKLSIFKELNVGSLIIDLRFLRQHQVHYKNIKKVALEYAAIGCSRPPFPADMAANMVP